MITARFWRILLKPPLRHALYRRSLVPLPSQTWLRGLSGLMSPYLPLAYLFGGMTLCCALSTYSRLFVVIVAVLLLFNCTIYAIGWAMRTAGHIATWRENSTWDLLCILPFGAIGAAYAISAGAAHRDGGFSRLYQRQVRVVVAFAAILLVMIPCFILDDAGRTEFVRPNTLILYGYLLAALAVAYVDFVQSSVLGSLIGILGGLQTSRPVDAQFWAGGVFLALQSLLYGLPLIIAFVLLPPIPTQVDAGQLVAETGLFLLRLALFVGPRALVIELVWRLAARRLQATPDDLTALRQAD